MFSCFLRHNHAMQMILNLLVAFIYFMIAIDFWRNSVDAKQNWHRYAILIGLLLHALLLNNTLFANGLNLGFANALSATLWLTVLIYWLSSLKQNLRALQAFALPLAGLCVLLQMALPESHLLNYTNEPYFKAHIIIAMLAYSLFTFAALHALLMSLAERKLHNQTSWVTLPSFPPLLPMEKLLFRVISVGFVLLSLTLISGVLFSEALFHQAMKFNHKNIFAMLSWLIYGGLLLGHFQFGWRGRKAIRWTLTGFALLLLAYAGSKFVLEILLQR